MAAEIPTVTVVVKADTRPLRQQLALARLSLERSWWRRLLLRLEITRINREATP